MKKVFKEQLDMEKQAIIFLAKGSQYRELLEDKNKSIDEKVSIIIIVMEMLLSNWALYDLNIIVYWNQKKQLRNM
ncbi:hypothetical protein [Mycoplasmopsis cynos]|uniref:hypothetical protein n=1 Tax=Mycoplasmopsis cynos TaxID=171284 RepID=UPI0024C70EFF|nr:hypothetical protein [Mycoplasmopsis cynos]WAM07901.1 hypothetical protein ONA21_00790 [Mycoplasmopsis cynos]